MKKIVIIPARYGSTRLPGKPLQLLGGKPLIRWVYERASLSRLSDEVLIATDDKRIEAVAHEFGAEVALTSPECRSGTDRVYQALEGREADLVVNLQGDEPFVHPSMIDMLFEALEKERLEMATLCCPITKEEEYDNPNTVKVVLDRNGFALYFSRSPIPYMREHTVITPIYAHVGMYGFSRIFLDRFAAMEKSPLEKAESLEQLRALENGFKIKVIPVVYEGFGIDTEEDLKRAEELLIGYN